MYEYVLIISPYKLSLNYLSLLVMQICKYPQDEKGTSLQNTVQCLDLLQFYQ